MTALLTAPNFVSYCASLECHVNAMALHAQATCPEPTDPQTHRQTDFHWLVQLHCGFIPWPWWQVRLQGSRAVSKWVEECQLWILASLVVDWILLTYCPPSGLQWSPTYTRNANLTKNANNPTFLYCSVSVCLSVCLFVYPCTSFCCSHIQCYL